MNILILSEYFPASEKAEITGGIESRAFNIAKGLAKRHKVNIITSWQKGLKRYDKFCGFEVYRVGSHHGYSHSGSIVSRLKFANAAFKQGIKLKDIDIVDGYSFLTYLPAYKISRNLKKPCVITYHETWLGEWIKNKGLVTGILGGIWEKKVLRKKFDKIISVSNFTKKKLVKNRVKEEKIVIIPNGADLKQFSRIKAKKFSNPTICCINRLIPGKRTEDLIKALSIVRIEVPDIKCKIIGKGIEINSLKGLVYKLNLEKNVDFLGFVKRYEDVIKTLKASHLFCSASIVEGFGMVIIEAMACNIPFVCSDIEPFNEVTENGKGGLMFKAENYKDLAVKIIRLLKNKRLYNEKAGEAKALVKKYDWGRIVKKVERIYSKLI